MKNLKLIFFIIILFTNLLYSAIAYVTVDGAGSMDGSSWENALPGDSIQFAMDDYWNDEIWIARGVYKPTWLAHSTTDERNKRFNMDSKVYGGFAGYELNLWQRNIKENETIFSGDIGIEGDNSDNCYHVVWNLSTLIDGITISDGNANGNGKFNYNNCGGAIVTEDLPYTFRNCTFRNNYASDRGGAVASISNTRWSIIFDNCLFYDNHSGKGGAIYSWGKSTIITNCTIVNNTAEEGGGLYFEYIDIGKNEIINNIIWGNSPDQIDEYYAFGVFYSHNAIEGGYDGYCNMELSSKNEGFKNSPYFTDPTSNEWTLYSVSPCVDSGVYWNTHTTDITGSLRPQGLCYDMGAYEYESAEPNALLPTVSTLPAENITQTTATLKGDITDNGGTQIVAKGIRYSETSGFDPLTEGTLVRSLELLNEVEFEILAPNLLPETTYYFRAYCESRIGSAYSTEELSFTTIPETIITPDVNGILYVKENGSGDGSSWVNAINGNELQIGLDHADVSEVWVAKGKYIPMNWPCNYSKHKLDENDFIYRFQEYEESEDKYNGTTEREKHFMLRPNKKIYGGFDGTETSIDQRDIRVNETILSGDIGTEGYAPDNSYHVLYLYFEPDIDNTSVIDGFTISDGYADGAIWDDSYFGGGIFNRCSSPIIRNCIIKDNYAVWGGGMLNGYSDDYGWAKPLIYNTIITQNTADIEGGGIYNISGFPTLVNISITNNEAGEKGGGIFHWAEYPEFLIKDIFNIRHCTIAGNTGLEGSQLYSDSDPDNEVNIYNSIIWGDNENTIIDNASYHFLNKVIYCGITGGYESDYTEIECILDISSLNIGDINSPYFTDPDNNDYSLMYESICKDKAIYWYKTDEDVIGTLRPQGIAYDLGAYEFVTSDSNAVAPILNTSTADSITASTALCKTDVVSNGGTPIVGRGVAVSNIHNFNPEIQGKLYSLKGEFFDSEFTTLVSDLHQMVIYYYRSYAENRMGHTYGQEESFVADAIIPDGNGIYYVKEYGTGLGNSWASAMNGKDIQAAINNNNANQIWIAKGTYRPNSWRSGGTSDREKHFALKGGVIIYGGFDGTETNLSQRDYILNETIFTGDIGIEGVFADNSIHIFSNISEQVDLGGGNYKYSIDSTAVIDGFTVTNGFDDTYYYGGAGMYNKNANPTIRNCKFTNNYSRNFGGAIRSSNDSDGFFIDKSMTYENCLFDSNEAGRSGAIYNQGFCRFNLLNCEFTNNRSNGHSGALLSSGKTHIINCLFYNNEARRAGSAITFYTEYFDGSSKIINTTIVNNTAGESYGGIFTWVTSDNTILTNSVLFNNGGQLLMGNMYDTPDINNCAIEGGINFEHTGLNNITLSPNNAGDEFSPYFSGPDDNNYMIQAASPLRDAGIWTDDVPLYDIVGFLRDSLPDIGCYEYDESSIDNGQFIVDNCALYQNYPNPFNPITNISFYLNKNDKVELLLYNVAGQLVKKILDKELNTGSHSVVFEANDLNSGVYYYTLTTSDKKLTRKMLLVK